MKPKRKPKPTKAEIKAAASWTREVGPKDTVPEGISIVYGLTEPDSDVVKYVGQTKRPGRRLWLHRSPSNNKTSRRLHNWVRSLHAKGEQPRMVVLEETDNPDEAEVRWVASLRSKGVVLLNMNAGGKDLAHANRAATSPSFTGRWTPLQHFRQMSRQDIKVLRRLGYPDAADRVQAKWNLVESKISALAKRHGRRKVHAFFNACLSGDNHEEGKGVAPKGAAY